ncbi:MAG: c-type cytochrome, partial [Isosphaeraceae bacterium]|nr:c-type cytochrome [Isosphaeraceae bacterium]
LDAWSRAHWEPLARRLGPGPFAAAVAEEQRDAAGRVRAVEVLTELFGGLPRPAAEAGAKAQSPLVRARVAWSLGRVPVPEMTDLLLRLAMDEHPRARVTALEALADPGVLVEADDLRHVLPPNFAHADKRVRQAAARLAVRLDASSWAALWADLSGAVPQARLTAVLAAIERAQEQTVADEVIDAAASVLAQVRDPGLRLQALRLIVRALGDYNLDHPPLEVFTGYSPGRSLQGREALIARLLPAIRSVFPSGDERCDDEAARLLAMLEDNDTGTLSKVAAFWTDTSPATRDVHFLVVLARLRGQRDDEISNQTAAALLGLDRKLQGQEQRVKQSWNDRLAEVVTGLSQRDPSLADALLRSPDFARPSHVAIAMGLDEGHRIRAARLFLERVKEDPDFEWSGPLVALLGLLPAREVRPVFREQWDNLGLRDALLLRLAEGPEEVDREKFLEGLESGSPAVVRACLAALRRLPRDAEPQHLVPPLRLLRRLLAEPKERESRRLVLELLEHSFGERFDVAGEAAAGPAALRDLYQPVFDKIRQRHPTLAAALEGSDDDELRAWRAALAAIDWDRGDAARGEAIFRARSCWMCHAGASRIGPDLTGVAERFSRDDLLAAIVAPNRDVAPNFRVTVVETPDGRVISGIVVFESADGLILQTGAAETVRVATPDIASRHLSTQSLMPTGLLKGLKPADIADLFRYLQTLRPASAPSGPAREG